MADLRKSGGRSYTTPRRKSTPTHMSSSVDIDDDEYDGSVRSKGRTAPQTRMRTSTRSSSRTKSPTPPKNTMRQPNTSRNNKKTNASTDSTTSDKPKSKTPQRDTKFREDVERYLVGRIHRFFHTVGEVNIFRTGLRYLYESIRDVQRHAMAYLVQQLRDPTSAAAIAASKKMSTSAQIQEADALIVAFLDHPRTGGQNLLLPLLPNLSTTLHNATSHTGSSATSFIKHLERSLQYRLADVVDIWMVMELTVARSSRRKNVAYIRSAAAGRTAHIFSERFGGPPSTAK